MIRRIFKRILASIKQEIEWSRIKVENKQSRIHTNGDFMRRAR